jgi:hypothetical protein
MAGPVMCSWTARQSVINALKYITPRGRSSRSGTTATYSTPSRLQPPPRSLGRRGWRGRPTASSVTSIQPQQGQGLACARSRSTRAHGREHGAPGGYAGRTPPWRTTCRVRNLARRAHPPARARRTPSRDCVSLPRWHPTAPAGAHPHSLSGHSAPWDAAPLPLLYLQT